MVVEVLILMKREQSDYIDEAYDRMKDEKAEKEFETKEVIDERTEQMKICDSNECATCPIRGTKCFPC